MSTEILWFLYAFLSSFIQTVLLVPDSHRISRRMHLRVADLRMTYYRQ